MLRLRDWIRDMKPEQVTTRWLEALDVECKEVFGSVLYRIHRIGRRHKPTARRHRLLTLLRTLEACLLSGALMTDGQTLDIAELTATVRNCRRWYTDPAWPGIEKGLASADFFRHTTIMLGIAGHYADAPNHVGIHLESGKHSVPDLWLSGAGANPSIQRLHVEVKAPVALDRPSAPLSREDGEHVVVGAFRRSRHQLGKVEPGLLVIGGFNLQSTDVEALQKATQGHFLRFGGHKNIVGVVIFFARPQLDLIVHDASGNQVHQLSVPVYSHLVPNPDYQGSARVVET